MTNWSLKKKEFISVEKFLVARRFMYWQVYLHKTGVVAEQLLMRILKRAKELVQQNIQLNCSDALFYFLNTEINSKSFNTETLTIFSKLDDYDIISAMKDWQNHDDFVLSNLCQMIIKRDLLKIKLKNKPIKNSDLKIHSEALINKYNITKQEADYFVFKGELINQAYENKTQKINILFKSGKIKDIVKASDQLNLKALE